MTTFVHNIGKEFEANVLAGDLALPSSMDMLLFHDGEQSGDTTNGDDLAEGDDVSAITTEPDGNYARQSVALPGDITLNTNSGDWQIEVTSDPQFDLANASATDIDAYGLVVNWDAGGGAADHLWWTDTLDQKYDVDQQDTFTVDGALLTRQNV